MRVLLDGKQVGAIQINAVSSKAGSTYEALALNSPRKSTGHRQSERLGRLRQPVARQSDGLGAHSRDDWLLAK